MLYITVRDLNGDHELTWHIGSQVPNIFQPLNKNAPRREITEIQADGHELHFLSGIDGMPLLQKHAAPSSTERVMIWEGCWAGMIYGLLLSQQ